MRFWKSLERCRPISINELARNTAKKDCRITFSLAQSRWRKFSYFTVSSSAGGKASGHLKDLCKEVRS